jgi:hypothetical protein
MQPDVDFSTPVHALVTVASRDAGEAAAVDFAAVHGPDDQDNVAVPSPGQDAAVAAAELTALLQQFRQRLDDPLLPLPDPVVVRRRLFSVSKPATRRSRRIAARGKGLASSVVKRAQRILMHKLGICNEEERLTDSQLKEYEAIFASPLGPEQIEAISSLFGLRCVPAPEVGLGDDFVDDGDA